MNWTKLAVKSVKDVFSAVDSVLGTGNEGEIIGTNPKGDKSYKIDKVAEAAYLSNLPDDVTIVSEESEKKPGTEFIVFLDPVCGSILAKRGSRHFTTGISIYSSQLEPVCEAIGIFETGDVYHADENGAYKNGKAIHASKNKEIEESIINFEAYNVNERIGMAKAELIKKPTVIFCPGSLKLSLAMLSEGIIDGFVCAAEEYPSTELIGTFMVKKAGGIATDIKGRQLKIHPDLNHRASLVCASTKELHAAILKLL